MTAPAAPAPQPHSGAKVPVEFIGRARALRTAMAAADAEFEAAADRLLTPFRPRPGFSPVPRHAHLDRLARRWRALPTAGRLRRVVNSDPGDLQIAELRAAPFAMIFPGWDADELAITVVLRAVRIAPPDFAESTLNLTAIGLHALARRYQRGTDRRDAAVLADLPLGRHFGAHVRRGGDFAIPPPRGGRWIGAVMETGGAPLLVVRTFVNG